MDQSKNTDDEKDSEPAAGKTESEPPAENTIAVQVIKLKKVKLAITHSSEDMLTGCEDHVLH